MLDFKQNLIEMQEALREELLKNSGKIAVINSNSNIAYLVVKWDTSPVEGESVEDDYTSVTLSRLMYSEEKGYYFDNNNEIEDYEIFGEHAPLNLIEFKNVSEVVEAWYQKSLDFLNSEIIRSCETLEDSYPIAILEKPLSLETITKMYMGEPKKTIIDKAIGLLIKKTKHTSSHIYEFNEMSAYTIESLINTHRDYYKKKTALCNNFMKFQIALTKKESIESENIPF